MFFKDEALGRLLNFVWFTLTPIPIIVELSLFFMTYPASPFAESPDFSAGVHQSRPTRLRFCTGLFNWRSTSVCRRAKTVTSGLHTRDLQNWRHCPRCWEYSYWFLVAAQRKSRHRNQGTSICTKTRPTCFFHSTWRHSAWSNATEHFLKQRDVARIRSSIRTCTSFSFLTLKRRSNVASDRS